MTGKSLDALGRDDGNLWATQPAGKGRDMYRTEFVRGEVHIPGLRPAEIWQRMYPGLTPLLLRVRGKAPRETVVPLERRLSTAGPDTDLVIAFGDQFDVNVLAVVPAAA